MKKSIIFLIVIAFLSCKRKDYHSEIALDQNNIESLSLGDNSNSIINSDESLNKKDSIRMSARIVGIKDGDTVEALYNNQLLINVRLAHIDAPEKRGKQPFGAKSKKALSDLCFNKNVTLVSLGRGQFDRNGRLIAVIKGENNLNINMQMVRLGMAWHYKKYSKSKIYADLEQKAKNEKVGLWQDAHPVAPWDWRRR